MVEPVAMQAPTVTLTRNHTESPDRPNLTTRKSASFHKNLITKLRPLPFQYVWTVYHDKSVASASSSPDTTESNSTTSATAYTDRFTTLAPSVPDIAEFYKVFNNTPWSAVKSRDTVHIFRAGVKPLWEDPENIDGGCWTLKVRKQQLQAGDDDRSRPKRVWEEICLMGCGGELQAALAESGSRDHVLGMSFSPRLYWVHVSVWLKQGGDAMSTAVVQRTVLERLSPELRPKDQSEYFFKKHSEHEGWEQAVGRKKTGE